MYSGIINVYKEKDFTSFDVVAKLRGILKQKKIGHTGTLDPMAEGVLLVCLGNATKIAEVIVSKTKQYRATLLLGAETDTEDVTGVVTKLTELDGIDVLKYINVISPDIITTKIPARPTDEEIINCINSFVGEYMQIPPMYSAIKKDGKKLYQYARAGIEIEREARPVEIYSINIIEINYPTVTFDVVCSKGTYIRSLCRDIGAKLGVYGTMKDLLRLEVNGYDTNTAHTLGEIEEYMKSGRIEELIKPLDTLFARYPALYIQPDYAKALINGNKLVPKMLNLAENAESIYDIAVDGKLSRKKLSQITEEDNIFRVYDETGERMLALYKYVKEEGTFKPFKMFLDA